MAKPTHSFPKNRPFVAVLWHDPHSLDSTEVINAEDTHRLHRSLPMITHGYVMKEDGEGISVASEYCGENDFRNTTFIMRELILEVVPQPMPRRKKAAEIKVAP